MDLRFRSRYLGLECSETKVTFDKSIPQSFNKENNQPIRAVYNLSPCKPTDLIDFDLRSMWRYKAMLPILDENNIISLGEGYTPIFPLDKIKALLRLSNLSYKEEAFNPTGSFKARGMSVAISKAVELGMTKFCTPTAGNAGSALAAYSAKANAKAKIYMPKVTPETFVKDCLVMGAEVIRVDGSIRDAGMQMVKENDGSYWDVSTMKEPFRLEGKKTLGYEIAETMGWTLPDVIIYPTGGGTGLIGMWKAFAEMMTMGWIKDIPTRMIAVQMEGCDPIVKAFENKKDVSEVYDNPSELIANGLRVPKAFADKMIMNTIYESKGAAVRVSEEEMKRDINYLSLHEGILFSPEGAALISALKKMIDSKLVSSTDKVLMINTGSPYKYLENFKLSDFHN
jgi:threonine synthase